jgi:hypothetical protein
MIGSLGSLQCLFRLAFAMCNNNVQGQGTLTEGEDSVPLTSLLRQLVLSMGKLLFQFEQQLIQTS